MPWESLAQMRKFYATPSLHKYIAEYKAATPDISALPERKGKVNVDKQHKHAKKHPNSRVRKPQHAQRAAAKGPIYQTAEQEGIARRALHRA